MGPSPAKITALNQKIEQLGLKKTDFIESFARSSGKGGQHVNKTSSAVRVRHIPTGLDARGQDTRSLHLNRFLAMRRLVDKIEATINGVESKLLSEREKIRRQKRKRSKRAKEKVLHDKKINSEKKFKRSNGGVWE